MSNRFLRLDTQGRRCFAIKDKLDSPWLPTAKSRQQLLDTRLCFLLTSKEHIILPEGL